MKVKQLVGFADARFGVGCGAGWLLRRGSGPER